jgi:DNA-directed RNA polymerase subunit E'/Rpb7
MAAIRMPLFKPVYLDQRVALSPTEFREAAEDIDAFLLAKMKKGLEGHCCTHGYVRPGSTQILARSMGQAEHGRFTGDFMFHCKLKLQCLLPHADQLVDARILKVNKLGAYALVVDDGRVREAMRILIPRDLHIGSAEFDAIQVGQGIRVKLLRSRFQVNDAFIQAVGLFEGLAPAADAKEEVKETGKEQKEQKEQIDAAATQVEVA